MEELDHAAEDLIAVVNNIKKFTRKMEDIEDMAAEEMIQVFQSFTAFVILYYIYFHDFAKSICR